MRYRRDVESSVFDPPGRTDRKRPPSARRASRENDSNAIDHPAAKPTPRVNFIQRNVAGASCTKSRQKVRGSVTRKERVLNSIHATGSIPRAVSQWRAEKLAERNASPEARCPPGMRLMSEDEKIESIASLNAQKEEIEESLARRPLRLESQTLMRRFKEMEDQLDEIDRGAEKLKKKYVFVPQ